MAVIDILPGVEVSIISNGEKLKEYEDDDSEVEQLRTVTRFVEAISGREFEIQWRIDKSTEFKGDCMTVRIYVDGRRVHKQYTSCADIQRRGSSLGSCKGYRVSDTETKRFCFAGLEIGSDQGHADLAQVKDLGTIKVEAHHMWHPLGKEESRTERSARMGPARSTRRRLKARRCLTASDSFQAMLIVPREPSSGARTPLEEPDLNTLSQPDLVALLQRERSARGQEDTKLNIKREHEEHCTRSRKKARPSGASTRFELDDDGSFRETSTSAQPLVKPEIIVLD